MPAAFERDWSVGEITADGFKRPVSGADFTAAIERLVSSGLDRADVTVGFMRMIMAEGDRCAKSVAGLPVEPFLAALNTILVRDDFSVGMLINAMSYFGWQGTAIADYMKSEIPRWEDVTRRVAESGGIQY